MVNLKEILKVFTKIAIVLIMLYSGLIFVLETLLPEYGIFTTISFIISVFLGLVNGKIIEKPERILIFGVVSAISATLVREAIGQFTGILSDPLTAIISLIIIVIVWLKMNELRE